MDVVSQLFGFYICRIISKGQHGYWVFARPPSYYLLPIAEMTDDYFKEIDEKVLSDAS